MILLRTIDEFLDVLSDIAPRTAPWSVNQNGKLLNAADRCVFLAVCDSFPREDMCFGTYDLMVSIAHANDFVSGHDANLRADLLRAVGLYAPVVTDPGKVRHHDIRR